MRKCPIPGCRNQHRDYMLMCRSHWFTVSKETRDRVWQEFRVAPGTPEHLEAVQEAMNEAMAVGG